MDLELSKKYAKALKLTDKEKEYLEQFSGEEYTQEKNKIIEKHKKKLGLIDCGGEKGVNLGYNKGKKYETMSDSLKLQILTDDALLKPQEVCDKYGISRQQLYKLRANSKNYKTKLIHSTDDEEGKALAEIKQDVKLEVIKDVNQYVEDRLGTMGQAYDNLLAEMCNKQKISESKLSEVTTAFNAIASQMEKIQNRRDGIANSNGNTNIVILPSIVKPNDDEIDFVEVDSNGKPIADDTEVIENTEVVEEETENKPKPLIIG